MSKSKEYYCSDTDVRDIQTIIKPYILSIGLKNKAIILNNFNQAEQIDLQDLSKSAIKHLIITTNNYLSLTHHIRSRLAILFKNSNIKSLELHLSPKANRNFNMLIIYLSKLLFQNNSIKKITLSFIRFEYGYTPLEIKAMIYLFHSVRNRLTEYIGFDDYICDEKEVNKFIFNSKNLKEAHFHVDSFQKSKYLLCSKKTFNDYTIELSNNSEMDSKFWCDVFNLKYDINEDLNDSEGISLTNSKDKDNNVNYDRIEITNLELSYKNNVDSKSIDQILSIIRNSYIFKVENLNLALIHIIKDKKDQIQVVNEILKLSLNTLNTVKRVSLSINSDEFKEIFSKLNTKEYNIKRMPRIYLIPICNDKKFSEVIFNNEEYEEDINDINDTNDNNNKLIEKKSSNSTYSLNKLDLEVSTCNYTINISKFDDIFKNLIDLIEFIKIFCHCYSIKIRIKEDIENLETYLNNKEQILDNFINSFNGGYIENNLKRKLKINNLYFEFNDKQTSFNSLYFFILEILISIFKVESLKIVNCPFQDLISFMNKQINNKEKNKIRSCDSFISKILNIEFENNKITADEVRKLYSFSNIIKNKIILNICSTENEILISKNTNNSYDYHSEEIIKIFNLINETNSNFIETTYFTPENISLRSEKILEKNIIRIKSDSEVSSFIDKIERLYSNKDSSAVIRIQILSFKSCISANQIICLFSVLKNLINNFTSSKYCSYIQNIHLFLLKNKFSKADRQVHFAVLEFLAYIKTKQYYLNDGNNKKKYSYMQNFNFNILSQCKINEYTNKYTKRINTFNKKILY